MIHYQSMIEIKNITKQYGQMKALDDVSFVIGRGEFVCLVGQSGAGKSTLVRLLICEERPTSGHIYIAGRDITKLRPKELPYYRRKIGVVFQDYKLLPQKSVWENIAFALEACEVPEQLIHQKVGRILALVGLERQTSNLPAELSGGEKQRVSIARALIHSPKILIADEPTGNLDPQNTWDIINLLRRINEQGTVVVLATHDREIVDRLKRRVVALRNGRLVADRKSSGYIS